MFFGPYINILNQFQCIQIVLWIMDLDSFCIIMAIIRHSHTLEMKFCAFVNIRIKFMDYI